jgi:hypothetical protein
MSNADAPPLVPQMMPRPIRGALTHIKPRAEGAGATPFDPHQCDRLGAWIINRAPKIGTLQVGAPGDIAIMELVEGPVSFVDNRNNKRDGKACLKPVQTVINGVPFGRPYQAPFAVR